MKKGSPFKQVRVSKLQSYTRVQIYKHNFTGKPCRCVKLFCNCSFCVNVHQCFDRFGVKLNKYRNCIQVFAVSKCLKKPKRYLFVPFRVWLDLGYN